MDKRLLFPALAMTAVAQTTSPANAKAEKALRARAEQFYKYEIAKSRQAETLVAQESKDYFYNSGKPNMKDVKIGQIEFTDGGKKAIVHIVATVQLSAPGIGTQDFSAPAMSNWKLEKSQWYWYFDKDTALATPFGKMKFGDPKPGGGMMDLAQQSSVAAASIDSLVTVDHESVVLTAAHPEGTVTLSNGLPGAIGVELEGKAIEGISAKVDNKTVKAGEKAILRLRRTADTRSSGTLVLKVSPLNQNFEIRVTSE